MERPTWSCGHPVSPDPSTEEARLHVGHACIQYQEDQLARHAEVALLTGSTHGFRRCAGLLAALKA